MFSCTVRKLDETKSYTVSGKTLNVVLELLYSRWFVSTYDGDQDNDDGVIDATKLLENELNIT